MLQNSERIETAMKQASAVSFAQRVIQVTAVNTALMGAVFAYENGTTWGTIGAVIIGASMLSAVWLASKTRIVLDGYYHSLSVTKIYNQLLQNPLAAAKVSPSQLELFKLPKIEAKDNGNVN